MSVPPVSGRPRHAEVRHVCLFEPLEQRALLSAAGWPDVAVENLAVPQSAAAGDTITVQYDLVNHGDQTFRDGGLDYIYFGATSKPRLSTIPSATAAHLAEIAPGGTLHVSQDITLALSESGTKYLVVLANPYEKIAEGRQTKNNRAYATVAVTAAPPADLVPISITVPSLAIGASAHITAVIKNNGPNTAIGGWTDAVYLSADSKVDAGDVLLGTVQRGADVAAGGSYTLDLTADVPGEAAACKYLIVKADYDRAANETASGMGNNAKAALGWVEGAAVVGAYDDMFLARAATFKLKVKSYSDLPGATVSLALSNFSPLSIIPEAAGADVPLVTGVRLAEGSSSQTLTIHPAGAALGRYDLSLSVKYQGSLISQQVVEVIIVDTLVQKNDRVGDAVGGSGFEVYNMAVARAGDSLLFHVGTNYDGADGDLRIASGSAASASVAGIALENRDGLVAGDLYTGAAFAVGQPGARYPALIDTYAAHVAGQSFATIEDHSGYGVWAYDILAGVNIAALGPQAATSAVKLSWTMYCGNDYQELSFRKTQPLSNWIAGTIRSDSVRSSLAAAVAGDYQVSRSDMIDILRDGGAGGVSSTELADLRTVVRNGLLLGMPDSVRVLAMRVVDGDLANRHYKSAALGNLRSGSTQTHMENLVQKWFYGADRPDAAGYTYRQVSGSLFVGGAAYQDINQGTLGDCYFLAALANIAYSSPETISNMIVDNGDGTYAVAFRGPKVVDWVTVDRYLPTASGYLTYAGYGDYYSDGSNELWVPLMEKAYAQFADSGRTAHGTATSNAYADIEEGLVSLALRELTGRRTSDTSTVDSSGAGNTRSKMINAFNRGQWVWVSTGSSVANLDLIEDHTYALVGYDSTSGVFTIFNPWGINNGVVPGLVNLTWSQLQLDCPSWGATV